MSSSDEPPGWGSFAVREVPAGLEETVSPEAELAGVLQRRHDDLSAARGAAAGAAADARSTVFELASLVGRLDQVIVAAEARMADSGQQRLHRQLRVLKDQMLQCLGDDDVEVRDPLGRTAQDVADWTDPVGWRHGPQFTEEVVAQTDEPAVFHRDVVVRLARVVMGSPDGTAPAEAEPETEPEEVAKEAAAEAAPEEASAQASASAAEAGGNA